ncbi:UDP-N-acetylmuramoyl-L-alanyl-D-glutamate--2,6-diaminopimelate ligase [Allocatelliglobosispora scoriae]|uniref:UDP-N-acetylmuramoyl-L-alanyl-D-glutamate--2,6-diaminopimelate ligase n=1 Tax=Allocatelliglobosispora scoriae TaxID=643052 RepID=A0A841BR27_9ACTN|nr:UDP-N-acetylmuramoyl-L-alanyl-D-glutamate--2,6-diaminopimelate ligase [Allocatelliglobosispora scoriae]MBB5869373.1 UDP-N-acetylmuramoyl-L-alanyl-D-glutamate--2,6-diaminopimelate ligase [Allocatelliglobosispora scoriae]
MSATPRPGGVPPVALREIAALAGAPLPADNPQVTGVTHAGSEVRPGDLYAGLPGSRRHGAEFAAQARDAGAVAVLTDAAGAEQAAATGLPVLVVPDPRAVLGAVADLVFGAPTAALTVIGITGTAGKTSTAYLVESGLRAAGHVTGLIGTVETRLGDLVIDSARTTPEAADLHALLAVARERGVTAVVMEVSSHALTLGRVGGVRFAAVGWTNFGMDHLDFHADAEEYFAAKASLFDGRAAAEVINRDDPALEPLLRPGTLTYSAAGDPAATWRADKISGGYDQSFLALGPDGIVVDAGVAIAGRHNVANALLGLALLAAVGVDPATAARGIAACPGVPGRLERVTVPGEILGVVDYAHKPDAIVAALRALRELAEHRHGRLICVIGAGGDRDRGKRPMMGAAAVAADLVLVTDDNPRTEDPAAIRAEVIAGTHGSATEVVEVAGRRRALDEAVRRAEPGDVIAVLGKGHERGQEIHGQVLPFDDRIELADALTARSTR